MKVQELIDYINESDGDITAININNNIEKVILNGVTGSKDCFNDLNLPKGQYILLRAIDTITIE
tara:strand:+ start:1732 stop:1923 length:192 start_codon:yes stop_codon:yes gene_type:complete